MLFFKKFVNKFKKNPFESDKVKLNRKELEVKYTKLKDDYDRELKKSRNRLVMLEHIDSNMENLFGKKILGDNLYNENIVDFSDVTNDINLKLFNIYNEKCLWAETERLKLKVKIKFLTVLSIILGVLLILSYILMYIK